MWSLLASLILSGCVSSAPVVEPTPEVEAPAVAPTAAPPAGLPRVITPNMRVLGISLPAAQVDALGLATKDHVDLLVTGAAPGEAVQTRDLIQNLVVLSVEPDPGTGERVVSVLVTPEEAQGLALVLGHARVGVALRHEEDVSTKAKPSATDRLPIVPSRDLARGQLQRDEAPVAPSEDKPVRRELAHRPPSPPRMPPPGMRSVPLPTTAAGRIGQRLRPGDRVDVVAMDHEPEPWSRLLAQNLEVLGVSGEPGQPGAVSVAIRAEDTGLLAASAEHSVVVVLRNPEDVNTEMDLAPTTWPTLFKRWRLQSERGHTCPPFPLRPPANRRR